MDNSIAWTPGITLENVEQQVIEKAFNFYRGNKTQTAQSLGISVRTLDTKLGRYKQLDYDHRRTMHEVSEKRRELAARQRGGIFIPQPFEDEAPGVEVSAVAADPDEFHLPPPASSPSKKVVVGGR